VKRGDLDCEYPVREGAASRYADLKLTSEKLDRENRELKELFAFIVSTPETEAFEVYRRLRATGDPIATLKFIKDADTLLRNPSPDGYGTADAEVWTIDTAALARSVIKVPARPWTSVTGDGLISDLVSSFFKWDAPFIWSLIDRELFVRDMRHASLLSSQFCSPFLVNALCAMRSVSHAYLTFQPLVSASLTFLLECNADILREYPTCQPGGSSQPCLTLLCGGQAPPRP
jgi:hypothetical protein